MRNWEDQIMSKFPSNYNNNNNKRRKEEEELFFCRVKSSVGGGMGNKQRGEQGRWGEKKQSQTKGHELYAL